MQARVRQHEGNEMTIKCGACGQDLEIAGTIADGQPILCPVCGETTAYSRPSRIELPTGASRPRSPDPAPPSENDADIPDLPSEEARPKLHIRRPQATNAAASGRANDVVRQVEARTNAERKRARAKRLKAQVNNVVALVVLAAIGFGGYKVYRVWKGDETLELPSAVEGLVGKLKQANEEAEARQAAEDAARAEAERQRELERMREREAKEAADAEKRNAEKKGQEAFFAVRNGFAGAKLAYWGELPKERRPGACECSFGLLVPRGRGRCEYFRIDSRTDGLTVWRLSDKVPPKEVPKAEYEKLMTEHGGFFLKDGAAYFVTASGKGKITAAPTGRGERFCPAKTVFGDAYPILGERLIETAGRGFDVFFALDEKSEPVKVASVTFDGEVGYASFEKVARDIADSVRKRSEPPSAKVAKTKRTVVFYDGSRIGTDVNGVTRIPRKRPTNNTDTLRRWLDLRDVALREEAEIQRKHAETRRAREEWRKKMNEPPSDFEVRRVLAAGVVTVKRK